MLYDRVIYTKCASFPKKSDGGSSKQPWRHTPNVDLIPYERKIQLCHFPSEDFLKIL